MYVPCHEKGFFVRTQKTASVASLSRPFLGGPPRLGSSSWPQCSTSRVRRDIPWGRRLHALQSDALFADVLPFDQTLCNIYWLELWSFVRAFQRKITAKKKIRASRENNLTIGGGKTMGVEPKKYGIMTDVLVMFYKTT